MEKNKINNEKRFWEVLTRNSNTSPYIVKADELTEVEAQDLAGRLEESNSYFEVKYDISLPFGNGGEVSPYNYMLLDKMKSDNDYFLGNGNGYEKHLHMLSVEEQISEMKKMWNRFPEDKKPEWLSMEDILDYETKMNDKLKSKMANSGEIDKGTKIVYYQDGNYDDKWFKDVEKYYLDRGFTNVIAEKYANGGEIEKGGLREVWDRDDNFTYDTRIELLKQIGFITQKGLPDNVAKKSANLSFDEIPTHVKYPLIDNYKRGNLIFGDGGSIDALGYETGTIDASGKMWHHAIESNNSKLRMITNSIPKEIPNTKEAYDEQQELRALKTKYEADNLELMDSFGGEAAYKTWLENYVEETALPFGGGGSTQETNLQKLEKGLTNQFIPENIKEKMRVKIAELKKIEEKEVVEVVEEIVIEKTTQPSLADLNKRLIIAKKMVAKKPELKARVSIIEKMIAKFKEKAENVIDDWTLIAVENELHNYKSILKNINHPTNKRYSKKNIEIVILELENKLKDIQERDGVEQVEETKPESTPIVSFNPDNVSEKTKKDAEFYFSDKYNLTMYDLSNQLVERVQMKNDFDAKRITPSQVIGKGYKPQYARGLAKEWLDDQLELTKYLIAKFDEKNKLTESQKQEKPLEANDVRLHSWVQNKETKIKAKVWNVDVTSNQFQLEDEYGTKDNMWRSAKDWKIIPTPKQKAEPTTELEKEIEKLKKQLIAEANKKGIDENFGDKEIIMLNDKYGYDKKPIQDFESWAMDFDISQFGKGGETSKTAKIDFHENDYKKLIGDAPDYPFYSVKEGYKQIIHDENTNEKLGYWNAKTRELILNTKAKGFNNIEAWLTNNSFSTQFEKGGELTSDDNFDYELIIQPNYKYQNTAKRWIEDNDKKSIKYKLAVLLIKGVKDPDEKLEIKEATRYGRLLRSLEKISGESKHEMSWRTENYTLTEAEEWTTNSLRDIFYLSGSMSEKGVEGLFTKKAKAKGFTSVEYAKKILANPTKYTSHTKRQAQFVKNTNPELF